MSCFEWSGYLDIAREFCGKANGATLTPEAKLRCAISRAYYGAFCSARNYLASTGNQFSIDASVHGLVKDKFYQSDDKTCKQIAENLKRLRLLRNKADYNNIYRGDARKTLQYEAVTSLSYSEFVFNDLKKLSIKE